MQTVPVEHMRSHRGARIYLDLQTLLACIRLPRDAAWRIAWMKTAQPGEVFIAPGEILRAAGIRVQWRSRQAAWRRLRIHHAFQIHMQISPGSEQAEGMARGD